MIRLQATCFVLVASLVLSQEAVAQPEQDKQDEIPEGFEVQELALGCQILKPVGWKFDKQEANNGMTLAFQMWEPLPNDAPGFETCVMVQIIGNTEDAGKSPSEYAALYLESLKETGKVVQEFGPKDTQGWIQSSIVVDQEQTPDGEEKEYRLRTVCFADDELKLLYVLNFGTPKADWKTHEPTFRTMSGKLKLIKKSRKTGSDK